MISWLAYKQSYQTKLSQFRPAIKTISYQIIFCCRGYCVKNGPHCAFAHGANDLRPPVYDSREQREIMDGGDDKLGPNNLDKERSLLNDDPKWLDTTYVLANYKTEQCKKPPRLCR